MLYYIAENENWNKLGEYYCVLLSAILSNDISVCNRYFEAREEVIDSEIVRLIYRPAFQLYFINFWPEKWLDFFSPQ